MSKGAATEGVLGSLHAKVARVMAKVLEKYERDLDAAAAAEGISDATEELLLKEPNPAMLSAIAKFLKDNDISADTGDLEDLNSIQHRLAEKRKRRGNIVPLREVSVAESG